MTWTGSRGLMIGAGAVATFIGAFLVIRVLGLGLPMGPLEEGAAAYDRGDYRKARSLALAAQKGLPVDPRASRLMARAVGRPNRCRVRIVKEAIQNAELSAQLSCRRSGGCS